jgi:type I restriction enzyme S subunit
MEIDTRAFGDLFAMPPRNGLTRPKAIRGAGAKMVNMGELFAYSRIHNAEMDRVPINKAEAERFTLEKGDLLFARQSLVLEGAGKCSIFLGDDEPVTFESHVTRVRLNAGEADPWFYFYYLRSPHGRAAISSIVEQGAGASGIRGSDLGGLQVIWWPIHEQRAIAHFLGALDDRIDLLRQTNATLEAVAQALFKSWFVDFDPVRAKLEGREPQGMDAATAALFPDGFEESELGAIPRGWAVTALDGVAKIVKGRSYKSSELAESETALVTLKSFERGGGFRLDGFKSYTGTYKPDQIVQVGECIVAFTDVTQQAEVIGRAALVLPSPAHSNLVASLDVGIVRPSHAGVSPLFLYFLLQGERYVSHIRGFTSGTTVLHLAKDGVPSFRFALPPLAIAQAFTAAAQALWMRLVHNETMQLELASLRDALLPRLISGKLRLPAAREQIEDAMA